MVPVIHEFRKRGHRVILAADRLPLELLRREFPSLEWIRFPSPGVWYPRKLHLILFLILYLPVLAGGMVYEHFKLKKLIKKFNIHLVISDNRYGLWTRKLPCIIVTHQMMLKLPSIVSFLEYPVHLAVRCLVAPFHQCWIPDYPDEPSLSGDLSHQYPLPFHAAFIGPLSQFMNRPVGCTQCEDIEFLAVLSGPEPRRSILEKEIIDFFTVHRKTLLLIRGTTRKCTICSLPDNITIADMLGTDELYEAFSRCCYVICRSGYSSVMDLFILGKQAILIPTPGQTEQGYLSEHLHRQRFFLTLRNIREELLSALNEIDQYRPPSTEHRKPFLEKIITRLTGEMEAPQEEQACRHTY